MSSEIIALIGPPGSGKGTQGNFLAKKLNLPHLSIGDVFRKMIQENNAEGLLLNKYMQEGKLAPPELVNQIAERVLLQPEYIDGCLLDGYPRSVEQAKFLDQFAKSKLKVIFLQINDEIATRRILNRFNCADCNAIYNYDLNDSENRCSACGGTNFINRKDDNAITINTRINIYKKETYPLVEYYRSKNNIIFVDAGKNMEEVGEELLTLLKKV